MEKRENALLDNLKSAILVAHFVEINLQMQCNINGQNWRKKKNHSYLNAASISVLQIKIPVQISFPIVFNYSQTGLKAELLNPSIPCRCWVSRIPFPCKNLPNIVLPTCILGWVCFLF